MAVAGTDEVGDDRAYLPLGGEVPVPGGDTEEEGVIGGQDVDGDQGVVGFGRGMHLGEDLLREGFRDSVVVMEWLASSSRLRLTTARKEKEKNEEEEKLVKGAI